MADKRELEQDREAELTPCADHDEQTGLRKIAKNSFKESVITEEQGWRDSVEVGWGPAQMGALSLVDIYTEQASFLDEIRWFLQWKRYPSNIQGQCITCFPQVTLVMGEIKVPIRPKVIIKEVYLQSHKVVTWAPTPKSPSTSTSHLRPFFLVMSTVIRNCSC